MSRLISWARPPVRWSRPVRVLVARGSMAYSAVTQPRPLPSSQRLTPFSTEAVHSTLVWPSSAIQLPSA